MARRRTRPRRRRGRTRHGGRLRPALRPGRGAARHPRRRLTSLPHSETTCPHREEVMPVPSSPHPAGFSLVDEAWIPVLDTTGQRRDVSLLGLFEQAENVRMIACELPTQTFAILRLALAILHRTTGGPPGEAAWRTLWRDPEAADRGHRRLSRRVPRPVRPATPDAPLLPGRRPAGGEGEHVRAGTAHRRRAGRPAVPDDPGRVRHGVDHPRRGGPLAGALPGVRHLRHQDRRGR